LLTTCKEDGAMESISIYKSRVVPKKDIALPSFLTLHTTHTTTEAISLILKKKR